MAINEIDFSIKVKRIERDATFPRICFHGLGKKTFSVVPYTPENIAETSARKSGNRTIERLRDKENKESAFLFAEGFNSTGYCATYEDSRVDEKNADDEFLAHFNNKSSQKLFKLHSRDFSVVFSYFPQKLMFAAGELLAEKSENYAKGIKNEPVDDDFAYEMSSVVRKRDSLYYQDFSLPELPFGAVEYSPSFIGEMANVEDSAISLKAFTRYEILELFRMEMEEKDYVFMLPILELLASGIEESGTMEYVLTIFVSLNEFLEHGKDNEHLVDFFLKDDNAKKVGDSINNLEFNKYEHTHKLMQSMTVPMRIFNYPVIQSSTVRRLISESTKEKLFNIIEFDFPISSNSLLPKDVHIVDRVKEIFSTIDFLESFNLALTEKRRRILVSDMVLYGEDNSTQNDIFDAFFDSYTNGNSSNLTYDNSNGKVAIVDNEDGSDNMPAVLTELLGVTDNTFKRFILHDSRLNSGVSKVRKEHMAVLLYALAFPGSVNVTTSAKVAYIIEYILNTHADNVDIVCDIFITLMTRFDNFEFSVDDWKNVVDDYNEKIRPQQSINISLASLSGNRFKHRESEILLDVIAKEYKNFRPIF